MEDVIDELGSCLQSMQDEYRNTMDEMPGAIDHISKAIEYLQASLDELTTHQYVVKPLIMKRFDV